MNTRIIAAALVVTGGLLAGPAVAADQGGYVGFAIGQSRAKVDQGEIDSSLASIGLGSSTSVDDTDIGFKVYAGYQFNKNFAIEGGYTDFGKSTSHSVITSGGSGTADGEWKAWSIDLSALGILPLNEKFSLFGRGGLSLWNLDFTLTANGPGGTASASESKSGVSPLLGIGATYSFTQQLALRAELERHFSVGDSDTTGKSDIDLISIGLQFRF
jgi:OmpA-OmpF porin, OOP family